jgi:hypothetical protein
MQHAATWRPTFFHHCVKESASVFCVRKSKVEMITASPLKSSAGKNPYASAPRVLDVSRQCFPYPAFIY